MSDSHLAPSGITGDLAQRRPFSDAAYILEHTGLQYRSKFDELLKSAGLPPLATAPDPILFQRNPLVRNLVSSFHAPLARTGTVDDTDRALIAELARVIDLHARTGMAPAPVALSESVGYVDAEGESHTISVWRKQSQADPLAERLASVLQQAFAGTLNAAVEVGDFSPEHINTIGGALKLLLNTIPEAADSMLSHVQVLCRSTAPSTANDGLASASRLSYPGVVFLGDLSLVSPLNTAEAILHEACHQRYGDLSQFTSMPAEGYKDDFGAKIATPWHRPNLTSTAWGVDKALTAAHVYLYLAYFYGVLHDTLESQTGAEAREIRRRMYSKMERTRFLLTALDSVGRVQLGYAGNALLDWMLRSAKAFPIHDDPDARMTRLAFERYIEEDGEFTAFARSVAHSNFSPTDERFVAFMEWMDELEPAMSNRFERCFRVQMPAVVATSEPSEFHGSGNEPLKTYSVARCSRVDRARALLLLSPEELNKHINGRLALSFVQFESDALDKFLDAQFRDRLMRNGSSQRRAAGITSPLH